ncbi:Hypothetical protein F387_02013 [Wohlfahrtiimonas chitiniclastica SH04]|uniref:Uncharacterized protein n=1 Tax=Wohlfahrtiimonas chitiniclastica SH04 TaxID=1261130 RepID=L8XTE7_9GAMM|nr:Hypothetical protein F387_02013 [Wohlfahrtiimonas chitiniclastica SH04]OYQ85908.1 hypothetical protein B9T21_09820 [Wohlfahrtiimonas chitiniclastica]
MRQNLFITWGNILVILQINLKHMSVNGNLLVVIVQIGKEIKLSLKIAHTFWLMISILITNVKVAHKKI